jgi:alkylation response protein AidB-like acyl-CoA dehydrogenase
MTRTGINVVPLRSITGEYKFNEVFLDDVPLQRADAIGPIGQGWRALVGAMGRERMALGGSAITLLRQLEELADAVGTSRRTDPVFRQRWARAWTRASTLRYTWLRIVSAGESTSPRMSMLKLEASELQQSVAALAVESLGSAAEPRWHHRYLDARGVTIAGGTSEMQRDIIAERVLGLPRRAR